MFPGRRSQRAPIWVQTGAVAPSQIGFKFHYKLSYSYVFQLLLCVCFTGFLYFLSFCCIYLWILLVSKNIKYWYYSYLCFPFFHMFCIRNSLLPRSNELSIFRISDVFLPRLLRVCVVVWVNTCELWLRKLLSFGMCRDNSLNVRSSEKGCLVSSLVIVFFLFLYTVRSYEYFWWCLFRFVLF